MSRSVLIVYAGGTIGMEASQNGFTPGNRFADRIGTLLVGSPDWTHRLIVLDPLLDSANADPQIWHQLADLLWAERERFDAAIVLHGTDTLAYTTSALSFLLLGLNKPVVVTGAQIPFSQPASDAGRNLQGAFACARAGVREVCIFFDGKLLRGNRARKRGTWVGNGFWSPHWPALACTKTSAGTAVEVNTDALLAPLPARHQPPPPIRSERAGIITLFPGIGASLLRAAADAYPAGLVLELYGAGTGPAADPAVRDALSAISANGTRLLGVSQCVEGILDPRLYETGRRLADCGVLNGRDLTPEAGLARLHALHCSKSRTFEVMGSHLIPLVGELTPANPS